MTRKIGKGLSFCSAKDDSDIVSYRQSLELFSKGFSDAAKLNNNISVFIDTNVLLRYYSISNTDRKQLLEFFKTNHERIFVTEQVQKEFTRNREEVINKYLENVTGNIPKDFKSGVMNNLTDFINQNKIILKDYQEVESELKKLNEKIQKLYGKLETDIKTSVKGYKELLVKDVFLDLLIKCQLLKGLGKDEIEFVVTEFEGLKKGIDTGNIEKELNKNNNSFPGMGDIKLKPNQPNGDYIIFHEMLKYVATKDEDIVFLTYDNTKGDWLNKEKAPHLHYIENVFRSTGRCIYILDAERVFDDILKTQLHSLIPLKEKENLNVDIYCGELNYKNFENYIHNAKYFADLSKANPNQRIDLYKEVKRNGYTTIEQLDKDVSISYRAAIAYNSSFSAVGVIRIGLAMLNEKYEEGQYSDPFLRSEYENFMGNMNNVQ